MEGELTIDQMFEATEAQTIKEHDTKAGDLGQDSGSGAAGQAQAPNAQGSNIDQNKPPIVDHAAQADDNTQPTTADGAGDEAKPPAGENEKGALPESLKPFEKLVGAKGWDISRPDEALPKILQSYQEMEQHSGNKGREVGLLNSRSQDLTNILSADAKIINEHRERAGLPLLPVDTRSIDDKLTAHETLLNDINAVLNGTDDGTAYKRLNKTLSEKHDQLRFEKYSAGKEAPQNNHIQQIKINAGQNAANLRARNPGINVDEKFDSIFTDPVLDPLFASWGIGPVEMVSTPERAEAAYKLAEMVHAYKNIDRIVDQKVKAIMDAKRKAGNASTPGNTADGSKQKTTNEPDANGYIRASFEDFEDFKNGF